MGTIELNMYGFVAVIAALIWVILLALNVAAYAVHCIEYGGYYSFRAAFREVAELMASPSVFLLISLIAAEFLIFVTQHITVV